MLRLSDRPAVRTIEMRRCGRHLPEPLRFGTERPVRNHVVLVPVGRAVSEHADSTRRQPGLCYSVIAKRTRLCCLPPLFLVVFFSSSGLDILRKHTIMLECSACFSPGLSTMYIFRVSFAQQWLSCYCLSCCFNFGWCSCGLQGRIQRDKRIHPSSSPLI